ncbi:hypothetical protein V512_003500 [Mesotoga sp. Brook.08.105.5.1]|nr:hypothetical protein V512_003500 [Mesotoga sp. Brook.08.105.5.1]
MNSGQSGCQIAERDLWKRLNGDPIGAIVVLEFYEQFHILSFTQAAISNRYGPLIRVLTNI